MALDILNSTTVVDSAKGDFATFGAVHLDILDAERSLHFWRDLIGLEETSRTNSEISLGAGGHELLVLHPGATAPVPRGYSGLYHLAIHLPTLAEFARIVARIQSAGYLHYPTDHLLSLADYLDDPDGIGLELTFETPQRMGSQSVGPNGMPAATDINGRRHSMREPIDLGWLFRRAPDGDIRRPLPDGTIVGHMHLWVGDLDAALAFYRDLIGFTQEQYAPQFGFADMSAGGAFRHRLAVNIWQGAGAPERPRGTAGMRYFTLRFRSQGDMAAAVTRLEGARWPAVHQGDGVAVRDPAGNAMLLMAPSASS